MQLDVDIEPILRFPHMTSIDNQMDECEGSFSPVHGGRACILILEVFNQFAFLPQTDRQKVMHKSPP